jgi:hypothetical protein
VTLNPDFGFAPGSDVLQPAALDVLDDLFGPLREVTNAIEIVGHTDDVPFDGPHGNLGLSNHRAMSVVEYLVDSGKIAEGRASTRGWGSAKPIADNDTAEGRSANRRIEIVLLVERGATVPTGTAGVTTPTTTTPPPEDDDAVTTTSTTATTGSGTHAGATTVVTVNEVTQGSFLLPDRE